MSSENKRLHYKVATAYHRSTLDECLETEKPITNRLAHLLIKTGIYSFYAYDDRIKCNRYILCDLGHNIGFPSWLHIYLD